MTDPRGPRPWTLSWVHMVLALAVGAGVPLLWLALAPADERPRLVVAAAGVQVAGAQGGHVSAPSVVPVSDVAPGPATVATVGAAPAPLIPRQRDPNGDLTPDITDFINQGEVPSMAEVIGRLHAAGVQGGLGAFNPPGTRPPLVGIAVSHDFELPPGYVRHHQFTDDGQRIEPILMFAPDHPLVAAAGDRGLDRAQDRVVPPALVPPGLPVRQIVVPQPAEPRK